MPVYEYECCVRFDEIHASDERPKVICPVCGRKARKLISCPTMLVTRDGFEDNNWKAKDQDKLHEARMENKRSIEQNWHKVESGQAEYNPGKTPEAYQPRQHLERSKKKLY